MSLNNINEGNFMKLNKVAVFAFLSLFIFSACEDNNDDDEDDEF